MMFLYQSLNARVRPGRIAIPQRQAGLRRAVMGAACHACGGWVIAAGLSTMAWADGTEAIDMPMPTASTPVQSVTPLNRVVVSGHSPQAMPMTVGSFSTRTGRQIDESPALTVEETISRMPNVSTTYGLTIRGISLFGPNGGNSRTATVMIDGVPQDNYGQEVSGLSVWDASHVTVHRGPQSALEGRHALAGVVRVQTRNPSEVWDVRGRVGLSDPWGHLAAVAVGGPLGGDVLAFRVSAEAQHRDGDVDNRTRGDRRWNQNDLLSVRGKLLFSPPGTGYRALLTLADQQRNRGSAWIEATLSPPAQRISWANQPSQSNNILRSVALEQTTHHAGVDWTLVSTFGRLRDHRVDDYDGTELDQGVFNGHHNDSLLTHELRGQFESNLGPGRVKGVFGAYWSRRRVHAQSGLLLPLAATLNELGLCPGRAACDSLVPTDSVLRNDQARLRLTNQALYTEVDYRLDAITWTVGVRRDRDTQQRRVAGATLADSAQAQGVIDQFTQDGLLEPDTAQSQLIRSDVWLPKLGVRYELTPRWTLGVTVQRGYRPGGVNFSPRWGATNFGPEFTNNYDFSVKGLISDQISLAVNAYRIDWRQQQVDIGTNDFNVLIVNAGRSRLHGMELELQARVAKPWVVWATWGISRTRFTEFVSTTGNFAGREFTLSPRQTLSLGATWKSQALTLNADVIFEGRTFGDPSNSPAKINPSHTLLNTKLSYALDTHTRFFCAGSNLLDQRGVVARYSSGPQRQLVQWSAGRMLHLGIEAAF